MQSRDSGCSRSDVSTRLTWILLVTIIYCQGWQPETTCTAAAADIDDNDDDDDDDDDVQYKDVACDSSRTCPRWMYCDRRTNSEKCVSCTSCEGGETVRDKCVDSPLYCLPSIDSLAMDSSYLCPALIVHNNECIIVCWTGSTIRVSLGTTCNIQCSQSNSSQTISNTTCVWDEMTGQAVWNNKQFPSGVTTTVNTKQKTWKPEQTTVLPSVEQSPRLLYGTTSNTDRQHTMKDAVISMIVVVAFCLVLVTVVMTTIAVRRACRKPDVTDANQTTPDPVKTPSHDNSESDVIAAAAGGGNVDGDGCAEIQMTAGQEATENSDESSDSDDNASHHVTQMMLNNISNSYDGIETYLSLHSDPFPSTRQERISQPFRTQNGVNLRVTPRDRDVETSCKLLIAEPENV